MATRAVIAETAVIIGSGMGGLVAGVAGGRHTFALAGIGMLCLGLLLAMRPLVSTASHGGDSGLTSPLFTGDLTQLDTADLG